MLVGFVERGAHYCLYNDFVGFSFLGNGTAERKQNPGHFRVLKKDSLLEVTQLS